MSRHFRVYALFLPALALMTLVSLGCETEQLGGPGATEGEKGTATAEEEDQMFTADVSNEALELAQGEEAELTLSIDRGDDFTQIVQIETSGGEGLTVNTDQTALSGEDDEMMDDEATLTIMAPAAADTREYSLEIVFTPAMGESITKQVLVTVTAAEPLDEDTDEDTAMEETELQDGTVAQ